MGSVAKGMDEVIAVGVGVFVLVILGVLIYEGYGQGYSNVNALGMAGITANYSKNFGPVPNTFGSTLQLVVFALAIIAVLVAIIMGLRDTFGGRSGGYLKA